MDHANKLGFIWEMTTNGILIDEKIIKKMEKTNKKCKECPDWKLCLGDAFHTWDFKNNKPNFCVREIFKDDLGS